MWIPTRLRPTATRKRLISRYLGGMLGLAADDDVVLAIKLPSGALKTFVRNDF